MPNKINNINIANFFKTIPDGLLSWFPNDKPLWYILENIGDAIQKIYNANPDEYDCPKKDVYIHKTVKNDLSAALFGPILIGKGCLLGPGVYIRDNVIVGENCVIGNSTEIKNSVFFNNIQVSHYNYIGDSILGNHAHLGAGAIISNVLLIKNKEQKNELKDIKIKMPDRSWVETGRKKFGALVGDYAEIGTNATINPGTLLEKNILVPPSLSIGGYFTKEYKFPKTIIYP